MAGAFGKGESSDRDLLLSVLSSTSTKREAKSYLSRFTPPKRARLDLSKQTTAVSREQSHKKQRYEPSRRNRSGVNLGDLYIHTAKAIDDSPVFTQNTVREPFLKTAAEPLHLALVKLRAPQLLSAETLDGIGHTLSQLRRLGLSSVVVLDCDTQHNVSGKTQEPGDWRRVVVHQADRIAASIDYHKGPGARRLDNIIEVSVIEEELVPTVSVRGKARVTFRELLLAPLRRGVIPVIPPIGYTSGTQIAVSVPSNDVVLALAREFAGIASSVSDEDPMETAERIRSLQSQISLDKLIILDPLGGIPSRDRPDGAHVFINMDQEFHDIISELIGGTNMTVLQKQSQDLLLGQKVVPSVSAGDIASFEPAKAEDASLQPSAPHALKVADPSISLGLEPHLRNLQLTQEVLALLPPTASAVLITPEEAANSDRPPTVPFQASGVGTRRQKNPLIHNLLTDKPPYSSSLPITRLTRSAITGHMPAQPQSYPTTFAKKGMPVTILPDPLKNPWVPPRPGSPRLTLNNPSIDLPRLVQLIEDSFNRKLDVQKYLKRVNDRIAGVVIAGEYEGGALLTWETPPGVVDDESETTRLRMVPYLDKFAVLKRSQGAGGVADIVFTAMVRTCFPNGVTWRSRRDNPVNKWYFERSRGTWKLPESNWTMFWTTEGLVKNKQTFLDYEGVSRGVIPSWADRDSVPD
ncbi:MAG: Amino-acid acetyltransferase, mitochondrial [Candelina submexicana]|nr:MAG: Amino-acid acetyltransferase, mitochondrial [Candelina submexicana]